MTYHSSTLESKSLLVDGHICFYSLIKMYIFLNIYINVISVVFYSSYNVGILINIVFHLSHNILQSTSPSGAAPQVAASSVCACGWEG